MLHCLDRPVRIEDAGPGAGPLHPEIGAFHEPKPWLNTEAYLRWSGRKDSHYAHTRLAQKWDDLIEQVHANGLQYVESSHFLSHLIPELRDRYDASFIHLYRDGRDFTRSGLERGWYQRGSRLEPIRTAIRRMTGLEVGNSFVDHRLAPPPEYDDGFERIAWLWTEINEQILGHLASVPEEDRMEVRVEAFDADSVRELLTFLGHTAEDRLVKQMTEVAERKPNRTEDHEVLPPDRWSEERTERFREIAGDMMRWLEYTHG